jgi:hypothetical protein
MYHDAGELNHQQKKNASHHLQLCPTLSPKMASYRLDGCNDSKFG